MAKAGDRDSEDYFVNSEGKRIFCKYWKPRLVNGGPPKALVFICHGAGEHCQTYDSVANALTEEGMLAFAHDHVGHGKSDGDRVHIVSFSTYTNDVVTHVETVRQRNPGVPCFIIGHSMGGTIVIKTALDNPNMFAGVILIAPAIVPKKEMATPFKVYLARAVSFVLPQLQVGPVQPEWVSRDPVVVQQYKDDPLVWHGGLKAKWAVVMLGAFGEIQSRLPEIAWPFLILHSKADKLCDFAGSQMMYDRASSKDKELKVYEDAYHQIHKEPDGVGQQAVASIVAWIKERVLIKAAL